MPTNSLNEQEQYFHDLKVVVPPKGMKLNAEAQKQLLFAEDNRDAKTFILKAKSNGKLWSDIYYGLGKNDDDLKAFIKNKQDNDFWYIDANHYKYLTYLLFKENINTWPVSDPKVLPVFPIEGSSAWQCYHKLLLEKPGFTTESIQNIESSSQYVLSYLLDDTNSKVAVRDVSNPVRGMVVGNVQSGKTANMEAIMSLAADYHYNFFIVLTGTIENLRKQTKERILDDFNNTMMRKFRCNLDFRFIENPSSASENPDRLQDLDLRDDTRKRYICICLKNSKRLADLRDWLNKDHNQKNKLKVLLIDDEADQASLNTADMSKEKTTRISQEIRQIVFAKDKHDKQDVPYCAMSYIGYTATPYGNFLNEADDKSLYPTDFICGLQTPAEYIGPGQIFGDENTGTDPLPIVNTISPNEIADVNQHISFLQHTLPKGMEEATLWFICTIAMFRIWDLKSPVSMLVHTSQRVDEHRTVADAINEYLVDLIKDSSRIERIKKVFEEQASKMSIEDFKDSMPDYHDLDKIHTYPSFDELKPYLDTILNNGVQHIEMNEDGDLKYGSGIHLCIDNCKSSSDDEENWVLRIIYPENKKDEEKCPAFIVVGGQTLSRGLTLKGLTVSYFLRSTVLGDALMQMGRWFGYRKGYEMLIRLWMSDKTVEQFKRLTKLDVDLRNLIDQYRVKNWDPKTYAPCIDTFPDFRYLKITSKGKMQKAQDVMVNYANKRGQTTKFYSDDRILKKNLETAIDFVNGLAPQDYERIKNLDNSLDAERDNPCIWFDQDYNEVFDFLGKLKFPNQAATIGDPSDMKKWFKEEYEAGHLKNFDIIIPSLKTSKGNEIHFTNGTTIFPVSRSQLKLESSDIANRVFRIPVITSPNDIISDIDLSSASHNLLIDFNNPKINGTTKRVQFGLSGTPLLILYFIDKQGGLGQNFGPNSKRVPLNLQNNLFGYYLYIPGGENNDSANDRNLIAVKLEFENNETEEENYETSM